MTATVGSTGFNPYASLYANQYGMGTGMNDDFMFNAYLASMGQGNTQFNPAFTGFNGQPATDTYQSSGSSGLGTGLKLGGVAGIGTTAGLYFLGGDKVNPVVDGKYDDGFLKSLEDPKVAEAELKKAKAGKIGDIVKTKLSLPNDITLAKEQYEAIEKVSKGEAWPSHITCPDALKRLSKEQAEEIVKEVNKIDMTKLANDVAKEHTLSGSKAELTRLNNIQSKIKVLSDTATTEELVKHVQANAKLYGITATKEEEIKAAAEKIVNNQTKAEFLKTFEDNAIAQKETVERLRNGLIGKVTLDSTGKKLAEGTAENVQKAWKTFKFNKAGKYGLIAAGVGLVLGWMFGGSKS